MCAIYAFMRYCDDLSDEPGRTADRAKVREKVASWRDESALRAGDYG